MQLKKHLFSLLCSWFLLFILMTGCLNSKSFTPVSVKVVSVSQYGGLILETQKITLDYGDSVNLSFSGGYKVKQVPFYPDFYGSRGCTILTDYGHGLTITTFDGNFNKNANVKPGETVQITLDKRKKYLREYKAYKIDPDIDKWEGQSDADYINARMVTVGKIQKGVLYRGSSPFNDFFGRTELMDKYIRDNNINCILDLADNEDMLANTKKLPSYVAQMVSNNQVITCHLGADYTDAENMDAIGNGLKTMIEKDGPYLIHCSLGRDRTGSVCALLEALCGASYEEIVSDYMESYKRLHNIDMDPNSLQYKLFKRRIDDTIEVGFCIKKNDFSKSNLQACAQAYLIKCGMTTEQVKKLIHLLIGNN